jgi:hypothetical protein
MTDAVDLINKNCVLVALSALTGKSPLQLVSEIVLAQPPEAEPPLENGLIDRMTYVRYLRGHGWRDYWRYDGTLPKSLPMTCLCILGPEEAGHAIALVDGALYDRGPESTWGRQIIAVIVPPMWPNELRRANALSSPWRTRAGR